VNRRFILDCDPGHDDAVALLTAARFLDVIGITTVFGNSNVTNTTRNALALCEAAGLDIAVHPGSDRPIAVDAAVHSAQSIHGQSGLDGAALPPPTRKPHDQDAVNFIIESALQETDLTIIAVAPLTNLARAITRAPQIVNRISEISIMGGSTTFGNVTAAAEFNIFADPEAAAVVFASKIPKRMVGLNVTTTFGIASEHIARLRTSGQLLAQEIAGALDYYLGRQSAHYQRQFAPMHDVCAVIPYSHPSLIEYQDLHVAVECQGTLTRGQTVCDQRGMRKDDSGAPGASSTAVAMTAQGDAIVEVVMDSLLYYP
jgi:purine nucleosidase